MRDPVPFDQAAARLVLLAARLEGVSLAPMPGGGIAVRGGQASEVLARMIECHRAAIAWTLAHQRALAAAIDRREGVA